MVSYVLGSFPTGYLAGSSRGLDVRTLGSGNIGATNVYRLMGRNWGVSVFFIDALKGLTAVRVSMLISHAWPSSALSQEMAGIIGAIFCIVGHSFPVWLKFRGGKGVATSTGALVGLMPLASLAVFLVWLVLFKTTRYVSLASMAAAVALPLTVGLLLKVKLVTGIDLFYFSVIIAALVIWRHRSNIQRLLNGTESRVKQ